MGGCGEVVAEEFSAEKGRVEPYRAGFAPMLYIVKIQYVRATQPREGMRSSPVRFSFE